MSLFSAGDRKEVRMANRIVQWTNGNVARWSLLTLKLDCGAYQAMMPDVGELERLHHNHSGPGF
jgi:hypothetical protein